MYKNAKLGIVFVVAILSIMSTAAVTTAYARLQQSDKQQPQPTTSDNGDTGPSVKAFKGSNTCVDLCIVKHPKQERCTGNDINSCPIPPGENLGKNCPQGSTVVSGRCTVQGPPIPPIHKCPDGTFTQGPCPLPKNCKSFNNGTNIFCVIHRTVVHNTHTTKIEQAATTTNNVNVFIITSCSADLNDGQLKWTTATLCDTSIALMHQDGLNIQFPEIDSYLKARGLE